MARWLTKLSNSGMIIIEGKHINEGGGHGAEVPSKVIFKGKTLDNWLKHKLMKEEFDLQCWIQTFDHKLEPIVSGVLMIYKIKHRNL